MSSKHPSSRRLFGFLVPYRSKLGSAFLCMIVYGATDGAVPLLIRSILDDVFGARDRRMLYVLPAILLGFALIRGAFGFAQQYLMASIGLGLVRDIRNKVAEKLLALSQSFFDQNSSGTLISRVTNDSLLVRQALTDSVTSFLRDTVRVIALLITAIYLDPLLGAVAFLGFPLGILPVLRFGKKVRRLSRSGQDQFGGLTSSLQEAIIGHSVVQSFGLEGPTAEKFRAENDSLTRTLRRAEKFGALSGPTNEILASFAIGGVILYGGMSVMSGVRTQGDFIAFITSLFLLYEPLKKLGRSNTIFQTGLSAADRIFEILDTPISVADQPGAKVLSGGPYNVEFRGVSFLYPQNELLPTPATTAASPASEQSRGWAIEGINLRVPEGRTVALVGMSGGGKSTIVKLLARVYDPVEGAILIGGNDLRDYTLTSLRNSIAVVGQQTFLFNDTISQNIRYGRLGATDAEVEAAARAANADQFVRRLPQGYQTVVGEQGLRLSGGERARVALARALLKDAPILILDEATASLDSESEALVQEAIDRLMTNRTVLVIAHRLATVRRADSIVVVNHGRIVEEGTHDELLRRNAEYAKLYAMQFRDENRDAVVQVSNN